MLAILHMIHSTCYAADRQALTTAIVVSTQAEVKTRVTIGI